MPFICSDFCIEPTYSTWRKTELGYQVTDFVATTYDDVDWLGLECADSGCVGKVHLLIVACINQPYLQSN